MTFFAFVVVCGTVYRVCTLSEEEIAEIREQCGAIKAEANTCFASQDYEAAVEKYSVSGERGSSSSLAS